MLQRRQEVVTYQQMTQPPSSASMQVHYHRDSHQDITRMKTHALTTMIGLQILGNVIGIQILAFDCSKNTTKVSQIANNMVEPCKQTQSKINTQDIIIQTVQTKIYENIHVSHCLITKLSLVTHCGTWSHASIYNNGLTDEVIKVTPETCREMHSQLMFQYKGTMFNDLIANATKAVSFTEHGHITADGTCSGQNFQTKQGFFENAIMQTTMRIRLEDYTTTSNRKDEVIHFADGQTCPNRDGSCFSADKGTSVWQDQTKNCDANEVDILYEGLAKIVSTRTDNNDTIMPGDAIIVETETKLFAHHVSTISSMCFQKIYDTNLPRIKIIVKDPVYGFFFKRHTEMIAQNMDISAYMNSKIYFVARKLYNTIENIYEEIKLASCTMEQKILKNKIKAIRQQKTSYGHILTDDPGYVGITAGDVTYILACTPVMIHVRQSDRCYQHLPITYNNKATFMETVGRTIVDTPGEIPCSPLTPPKFWIAGKWLKLDRGHFQMTEEPITLAPQKNQYNIKFDNLNNILLGGIYTNDDLEKFNKFVTFPQKQRKANDFVTSQILGSYNNEMSMNSLFSKEDLKKLKNSILTDLNEKIIIFGSYMGAIMGFCAIFNVIKTIITTATNFRMLQTTLGTGFHLLASGFTSVTNYLIRNNYNNNGGGGNSSTEMVPLSTPISTTDGENEQEDLQRSTGSQGDAIDSQYGRAREQMNIITVA